MSNADRKGPVAPHETDLLPRDLTPEELAAAPVLASLDRLLIEDLTDEEADAFTSEGQGTRSRHKSVNC